jgi:hypothetical protein
MIGLGSLANREGKNAEAADHLSLAATLARQLKTARAERAAMSNLAQVESDLGNTERAIEIGWEIVRRTRLLPYPIFYMEIGLENLSNYLVDAERLNEARPVAAEALSLVRRRPVSVNLLRVLQLWVRIATMEGQDADASRLLGWIDAAYVGLALERNIWETQHLEHLLSQLGSRLSEAELSDLAAEGARWDTDRAVSFTFDRIVRTGSEARSSS